VLACTRRQLDVCEDWKRARPERTEKSTLAGVAFKRFSAGVGSSRTVLDLEDGSRTKNHGLGLGFDVKEVWPWPWSCTCCPRTHPWLSVDSVVELPDPFDRQTLTVGRTHDE